MRCSLLILFISFCTGLFAQKETFDLASYTPPKTWKKQVAESSVQFSKENAAKGTYCLVTFLKSMPGTANAKENFDLAWTSILKEMVTITTAPEMQPPATENGWEAYSGYAPLEKEGNKGVAILVTSSGYNKMVNIIILTNTDSYEKEISAFLESIKLKKPVAETAKKNTPPVTITKQQTDKPTITAGGFAFSTTNFDNGWISTVQEDWVETIKGNVKVLLHYPNKKADEYNSVLLDGLKNAWNILVAPRYSSASNFEFKPIQSWQSIEFAEADLVEIKGGKTVHVVLFKKNFSGGEGKYIEIITPNKSAFEQEFGAYAKDEFAPIYDKLANLVTYNRFAVGLSDLIGKWTDKFSGNTYYANIYTGLSAGMSTYSSSQTFDFTSKQTYKWQIATANSYGGRTNFNTGKGAGTFKLLNNWQIYFSDMEGKPKTYNAFFSCVKGARLLWLQDTGYGGYSAYGKSE